VTWAIFGIVMTILVGWMLIRTVWLMSSHMGDASVSWPTRWHRFRRELRIFFFSMFLLFAVPLLWQWGGEDTSLRIAIGAGSLLAWWVLGRKSVVSFRQRRQGPTAQA
jgi:hypothetical protein